LLLQGGYGEPSLNGYFTKLSDAFKKFVAGSTSSNSSRYSPSIMFDGANGVGAQAMQEFVRRLEGVLNVTMFNTGINQIFKKFLFSVTIK
jgi:phosphoacetylglucosamine mutase